MKKFGIIVFIVAILIGVVFANLFSFGRVSGEVFNFSFGSSVKGSGVTASETRDVANFNGVDVGGIFQVDITVGKEVGVKIEADDNLMQFIQTDVNDGVLKITTAERLKSHNPLRIIVTAPEIDSIEASGASNVSLVGAKNSELRIDTSGASKVNLEGETALLSVEVSGASKVEAESLKAENATIDASGASHATVFVTGTLVSHASGASKVGYSGNPTRVEKNSSGASKVYKK